MVKGQPPMKDYPIITCFESEAIRRNDDTEIIKHNDPTIVESRPTIPTTITKIIILKPIVGPVHGRNIWILVDEAQNILKVEEEFEETRGVVSFASRRNQVGALPERLVRKKCVCWEIEALPQNVIVGGMVLAVEEHEVAGVIQM